MTEALATPPRGARLAIIVPALGVAQVVSWGSLFYAIAVLAEPMRRTLHLSSIEVFAGFSLALGISGLLSPLAGRLIDAYGGRIVLSIGSATAAWALLMLAVATNLPMLLFAWSIAGVAMSMTLYDPAFATLGRIAGSRYRQAVTALTLIAGFSSTVSWPLTHALEARFGWQGTLMLYALLEVIVALPAVFGLLPKHEMHAAPARETLEATPKMHGRGWVAACFTLVSFVFAGLSAHLVGMFELKAISATEAVFVLALIGPMQFTGRILEMLFGRRFSLIGIGICTLSILIVAMALLAALHGMSGLVFLFVALYGAANGVFTIVRGVLPGTLFGTEHLGALLGWLARPQFVALAAAPMTIALVLRYSSPAIVALLLCSAYLLALLCFLQAVRIARRR